MPRNFVKHTEETKEKIKKKMIEKYKGVSYPKKGLHCYHCNECNLSLYKFMKFHQSQCLFKEEEVKITKNEYQKEYQKKYREKNKEKKRIYQYNYYRNLI